MNTQTKNEIQFSNSFKNRLHIRVGVYTEKLNAFPYLVTQTGKSSEALCPRHYTDILQQVKERGAHTRTEVAARQADKKRERHKDKQTHKKRKLAGRDRCGDCSSRDR